MKVKFVFFMFILIVSLAGCSTTGDYILQSGDSKQGKGKEERYIYKSIDLVNMDRHQRIDMGLDLNCSPDGRHFFITDTYGSCFRKVYLYQDGQKEKEIFDFYDWFGEEAVRDMTEVRLFWGGRSDKIYLHTPFRDTLRLWVYSLKRGNWERMDIPTIKNSSFITSLHNTDMLLLKEGEKFYLVDPVKQTKEQLALPEKASIWDQKGHKILFTPYTDYHRYRNDERFRLGIYDVKLKKAEYFEIPVPVDTSSSINFVPNSEVKISYMATLKDEYNEVISVLVMYDVSSGISIFIPIGRGVKNIIGWDHAGKSIYGTDYIMTMQ